MSCRRMLRGAALAGLLAATPAIAGDDGRVVFREEGRASVYGVRASGPARQGRGRLARPFPRPRLRVSVRSGRGFGRRSPEHGAAIATNKHWATAQ